MVLVATRSERITIKPLLIVFRNYAGGILPQTLVAPHGYQQILWLFGPNHQITEVGTMNCFIHWTNDAGGLADFIRNVNIL